MIFYQLQEVSVAVGGGAIVFAVTTLLCIKFVTIVASSIVGSAMIIAAVDHFMHGSNTLDWVKLRLSNKLNHLKFTKLTYF